MIEFIYCKAIKVLGFDDKAIYLLSLYDYHIMQNHPNYNSKSTTSFRSIFFIPVFQKVDC